MPASPNSSASGRVRHFGRLMLRIGLFGVGAALLALIVAVLVTMASLPGFSDMMQKPNGQTVRVHAADGTVLVTLGPSYGEWLPYDRIPQVMRDAIVAVEDRRFYYHHGVDWRSAARALVRNIASGDVSEGFSTITMQVVRNTFAVERQGERSVQRKLIELRLSRLIERALTKDEILQLYVNQIYLGQRAYGFASAARVYFGKDIKHITLAEAAMLAGLPKAPSAYNPVVNPARAKLRQQYILQRMLALRDITRAQYDAAVAEPLALAGTPAQQFSVHAEYVAEMVRQAMVAQYGEDAYTRGLNVVTTIDSGSQDTAYRALRGGLSNYDARHGYRGPEGYVALPTDADNDARASAIAAAHMAQGSSDT